MLRGIGYVVARRLRGDDEDPEDWAMAVERLLNRLIARCGLAIGRSHRPAGKEEASFDPRERRHSPE